MELQFFGYMAVFAITSIFLHAIYVWSRVGIKDIPNARSLHSETTKKSGGMVFIPLFLLFAFLYLFQYKEQTIFPTQTRYLLLGTMFFCMLGFLDDLFHLSPNTRLFVELVFGFLWVFLVEPKLSLFGIQFLNPILSIFILGFLIIFIVNLVNFMDGLDLYLVGTFFMSASLWIPMFSKGFLPGGSYHILLLLLILSLSGFAFFNFPKAKLFMGDSGSLALGFLLITFPLLAVTEENKTFELAELFFLFPIFWIDGILTILIRIYQKKNIFYAHREHLYQFLTETKLGKSGTCFVMVFCNLPAMVVFSLFKLKLLPYEVPILSFYVGILLVYISIYFLVRFRLIQSRKNLA